MKTIAYLLSIIILIAFVSCNKDQAVGDNKNQILQNSFSQSGYKQFRWGMKVEEVLSLAPEFKNGWKDFGLTIPASIAFYCKYGANPNGTIPNPFASIDEKIVVYCDRGNQMGFAFYNSSLIAVVINQTANIENSFSADLDKKYGPKVTQGFQIGSVEMQVKAWFNNGDRLITFERQDEDNNESVTYFDEAFFDKFAVPIFEDLKKENLKQKSRLD
jgi:hypothetical protein